MKKFFITIQDHIQCLAMKILVVFFCNIPKFLAYRIADFLGISIFLLALEKRKQIYRNLEIAYPKGIPFHKQIFACKVFIHFMYFFLELFFVARLINKSNFRKYVTGAIDEMLEERKKTNKAIFVTGHLGSASMIGRVMKILGFDTTVVVRPVGPKNFNKMFTELFGEGQKVVMKKQAYSEFKKILEGRDPAYPSIYLDQHAGRKALHLDFMGEKAYCAAGAATLARNYKIPIFAGALIRTGKPKCRLEIQKIDPIITDNKQEDIEKITAECNKYLEKLIKKAPEQWFWMHRRWRN